jgi:hypothetical protein
MLDEVWKQNRKQKLNEADFVLKFYFFSVVFSPGGGENRKLFSFSYKGGFLAFIFQFLCLFDFISLVVVVVFAFAPLA